MKRRNIAGKSALGLALSNIASKIGGWFGIGYTATDPKRKLLDPRRYFALNRATANQLLSQNLPLLRSYCRDLERNNATARAGAEAVCALVVGTGIALEPDTGDEKTDQLIREQWEAFIAACDMDGRDLYTIQTEACREMVVTGEGVWRIVVDPDVAPKGEIPVRVLCLESEWLIDETPDPGQDAASAVAGIRLDRYGRPVEYVLANPAGGEPEPVAADRIIHVFERRRSMQARGETWFAPIIETLLNERDLVDAELYAAKQTAAMALVITSDHHEDPDVSEHGDSTDPATLIRVGGVARLDPGEDIKSFSHTRPSQQIAPFRQMLRGDIAAALRIPQRFLDRDVSRANYSSMRADMLDTDRLLAPVREWFGHQTAGKLYQAVLPFLALRAGIDVVPRAKYRLLPDGQPYIDPQKDANAAITAIAGGLSNFEGEIGKRGGDYRQVWEQAEKERIERALSSIKQIGEVQRAADASGVPGLTWAHVMTLDGAQSAPGAYLAASVAPPESTVVASDVPADGGKDEVATS